MIIEIEKKIEISVESFQLGGHTIEKYRSPQIGGGAVFIAPWIAENDNVKYIIYSTGKDPYFELSYLLIKALTKRISGDLENFSWLHNERETIEEAREVVLRLLSTHIDLDIKY